MRFLSTLATCSGFLSLASALHHHKRVPWTDPPFSVPEANLTAAAICPSGTDATGKTGGIVFLVHGTGANPIDTWSKGPYNLILPNVSPGYVICWADLPGHSMGNAATTAEYVAYNIKALAAKSSTGKVFVIGHSQGAGLNVPWALDFFPSTQQYVSGFIALSGDFHGVGSSSGQSSPAPVPSLGINLPQGQNSQGEALYQQSAGSQYLRAQNIDGGQALVGTTSLFTAMDEIIPPEPADSTLTGASNIEIQDLEACGPLHVVDHFLAPFDSGYFGLALDALAHGGVASTSRLDKAYCLGFKGNTLVNPLSAAAALASIVSDVYGLITPTSPYVSTAEPPLPQYVCDRYPTQGFTCASGLLQ